MPAKRSLICSAVPAPAWMASSMCAMIRREWSQRCVALSSDSTGHHACARCEHDVSARSCRCRTMSSASSSVGAMSTIVQPTRAAPVRDLRHGACCPCARSRLDVHVVLTLDRCEVHAVSPAVTNCRIPERDGGATGLVVEVLDGVEDPRERQRHDTHEAHEAGRQQALDPPAVERRTSRRPVRSCSTRASDVIR